MRNFNIVVIVAGINEEYQNNILSGIHEYAQRHNNINISHFIAFGGILKNNYHDLGEYNIFTLPDFKKFDGAILLTNTIPSPPVTNKIISNIKSAGIPAVSIDDNINGFYHIGIDNQSAIHNIVEHFINVHKFRKFKYISGPLNNPESFIRLKTFKSIIEEHSIVLDENDIFYGDFGSQSGKEAVKFFLETSSELPDAIISANDIMALSAIAALNKAGYSVPNDVSVSGFDDTYNARNYSPELTTVSRPLSISGKLACRVLINAIKNIPQNQNHLLDMHPRFSASCNCSDSKSDTLNVFKKRSNKLLDSAFFSISLINRMSSQLIECDDLNGYINTLKQFVSEINAEEFYLCLCSDWNIDFYTNEYGHGLNSNNYTTIGYTDKITVPLAYVNGDFVEFSDFDSRLMFPTLFDKSQKSKLYYFVPLHFRERCLGYTVILNSTFPMDGYMFQTWNITLSNTLENIRKIVNLDSIVHKMNKMYTIDNLSNINNRTGFTQKASKSFNICKNEGSQVMLMFIDMDGLKKINDTYGHKDGDRAICALADIIRQSCDNNEVYARFGGDEFLVFAPYYSENDAIALTKKIEENIKRFNDSSLYPYKIGASIGYHISVPEPDTELFQLVTLADNVMYENKKRKKISVYLKKENKKDC